MKIYLRAIERKQIKIRRSDRRILWSIRFKNKNKISFKAKLIMKIAIDIRAIGRQRTGDETYTLNLVKNLVEIDDKNQYLLLTDTNNDEVLKKIREKIFGVQRKNNFEIKSVLPASKIFWTFFSLPTFLKKNPVDVVHVQYITPWWLPKKTKLVTTIHDVSFCRLPKFIGFLDLFFLRLLIPISLKRANRIIAVSEFTKKEIIDCFKISEEKIVTVSNGGAGADFLVQKTQTEKQAVRKKYRIEGDYLLYVGTAQPRKKIPMLLDAFCRLKNEFGKDNPTIKRIKLVFTGARNSRNYDRLIADKLAEIKRKQPAIFNDIVEAGFVEAADLPALFQESLAFVMPSSYEGFGLPIIEAMASGVPVVCSDIPCHREVAGDSAVFFDLANEADFAKKLFEIIMNDDLRSKLIERGKYKSKSYNWENTASKTLKVYDALF